MAPILSNILDDYVFIPLSSIEILENKGYTSKEINHVINLFQIFELASSGARTLQESLLIQN